MLVEATGGDAGVELSIMKGALANVADGILLSSVSATMEGAPDGPVVMLGEHAASQEIGHVGIDNVAAARDVVDHLLSQGRRRIAPLGVQDTDTARLRYQGYRSALAAAGRPEVKGVAAVKPGWSPQSGYDAVARMLDRRTKMPDAIFAFNDSLAIGALRALQDRGVRVPDDVAVAGIDNTTQGAFASPPLTTIAPDLEELAARAIDLLEDQIAGRGEAHPAPILTPYKLIVRQSTASPA